MLHGLRKRHAERYLDEFVFRWNRRRHMRHSFDTLLGTGVGLGPATSGFRRLPGLKPARRALPPVSLPTHRIPSGSLIEITFLAVTAEQHIKEGKCALKWARFSCMKFAANAVRLQLHVLAYNLANFLRTAATPEAIESWSLTFLRERLIKTGTRLVRHGRYAIFQMAKVAIPRVVFVAILNMNNALRRPPLRATWA